MKKRAIVTGATGFVGSNLAKKLISNGLFFDGLAGKATLNSSNVKLFSYCFYLR